MRLILPTMNYRAPSGSPGTVGREGQPDFVKGAQLLRAIPSTRLSPLLVPRREEGQEVREPHSTPSAAVRMRGICRTPLHPRSALVLCAFIPRHAPGPWEGSAQGWGLGGGRQPRPLIPLALPSQLPNTPFLKFRCLRRQFRCFRNPAARASQPAWEGVCRFVRASIRKPPRAPCPCH